MEKRREVPNVLRLLPLVPTDGLPAEPDTCRPCRVTVISTTPGVKPVALGIVGESCSCLSLCMLVDVKQCEQA